MGGLEALSQWAGVCPQFQPGYTDRLQARDIFGLSMPREVHGQIFVMDTSLIRGLRQDLPK